MQVNYLGTIPLMIFRLQFKYDANFRSFAFSYDVWQIGTIWWSWTQWRPRNISIEFTFCVMKHWRNGPLGKVVCSSWRSDNQYHRPTFLLLWPMRVFCPRCIKYKPGSGLPSIHLLRINFGLMHHIITPVKARWPYAKQPNWCKKSDNVANEQMWLYAYQKDKPKTRCVFASSR